MLRPRLVAQEPAEKLPARVSRDDVRELHAARELLIVDLPVGDILPQSSTFACKRIIGTHLHDVRLDAHRLRGVPRDALLGRRGGHDVCEWKVAVKVVNQTHDAHVRDIRMVEQEALELRGGHLEAAHLEQLLDPVDDEQLREVVDDDLITSVEPPIDECLLVSRTHVQPDVAQSSQ